MLKVPAVPYVAKLPEPAKHKGTRLCLRKEKKTSKPLNLSLRLRHTAADAQCLGTVCSSSRRSRPLRAAGISASNVQIAGALHPPSAISLMES